MNDLNLSAELNRLSGRHRKPKSQKMLETRIEAYFCNKCELLGLLPIKLNTCSSNGFPDRLVIGPYGLTFYAELKRSTQEKLRPLQRYYMKKLNALGHYSRKVDTLQDADEYIEVMKSAIRAKELSEIHDNENTGKQ